MTLLDFNNPDTFEPYFTELARDASDEQLRATCRVAYERQQDGTLNDYIRAGRNAANKELRRRGINA